MASTRHDRNVPSKHTQPKTYKLTPKAIISFPYRMCNPPPAVGKVRSCGVTPLLKVRLEDVLNREHLPPLGLKDFEEWLLFVEMTPENLYFILWLREYKLRYNQWRSQTAFTNKNAAPGFPIDASTQYSSHLAMFYARAKQTFFTPGSEYELNLTSTLLAPFHTKSQSGSGGMPPHPPPELFREVELETYRTLEESLRRFVHGQLNNVGTTRVMCGIVAGVVISLAGALVPLAWSFATGTPRVMRFSALPGLWLGLTILFASLNGICMGVYIFGDLRQLRKFELARPPISKPTPLPLSFRRIDVGAGAPPRRSMSPARSVNTGKSDDYSLRTASTDDNIHISPAYYDDGVDAMEGLWDHAQHPEPTPNHPYRTSGASTNNEIPPLTIQTKDGMSFTSTASFIHPFDSQAGLDGDDDNITTFVDRLSGDNALSPSRLQPLSAFDFDALPRHPCPKTDHRGSRRSPYLPQIEPGSPLSRETHEIFDVMPVIPPPVAEPVSTSRGFTTRIRSIIRRQQEKCGLEKWRLQIGYLEPSDGTSSQTRSAGSSPAPLPPHHSSPYWQQRPGAKSKSSLSAMEAPTPAAAISSPTSPTLPTSPTSPIAPTTPERSRVSASTSDGSTTIASSSTNKEKHISERFRKMASVPAFAVPLTRVLSPVVVRAQWEIVVRSAIAALLATWVLIGIALAVPATRRGVHASS